MGKSDLSWEKVAGDEARRLTKDHFAEVDRLRAEAIANGAPLTHGELCVLQEEKALAEHRRQLDPYGLRPFWVTSEDSWAGAMEAMRQAERYKFYKKTVAAMQDQHGHIWVPWYWEVKICWRCRCRRFKKNGHTTYLNGLIPFRPKDRPPPQCRKHRKSTCPV